ncbi:MAG: hypothetical protein KKI12_03070 [Proteobacteria bacterium]|nr:hypothetical protein [Pseudomonadota bacterium]MBU4287135.1 hypothetical protein [Pseudomonadota bacterium]MBU4415463.1 hypothetical protein [Pseudomonadota bacterium]MCG2757148.1 hypothetical protein [Desulfobacteraceae bacterium]
MGQTGDSTGTKSEEQAEHNTGSINLLKIDFLLYANVDSSLKILKDKSQFLYITGWKKDPQTIHLDGNIASLSTLAIQETFEKHSLLSDFCVRLKF